MGSAKIEIANNALSELGEPALSSLTENSVAAEAIATHYDDTLEDLLGRVPWRFATQKIDLSRDVAVPLNEWQYQYTLPAGFMRMVAVYPRADFEIYGLKLYTNATALACDFVKKVDETYFPPTFVRYLSLELAVRCCMQVTGDVDLKTRLQVDTRLGAAAAMSADAQQRPNRSFEDSPFVNARFS